MNVAALVPPPLLPPPELSIYREQCLALLHRYFKMSVEVGRLPALLGREVFRTRARSYRVTTFEDVVIFVHDVECCLRRLSAFDQELITHLVFQEYTQDEVAALMGCTRQTVNARLPDAVDTLTEVFMSIGLLRAQTRHYKRRAVAVASREGTGTNGCAEELAPSADHQVPLTGAQPGCAKKLVNPPSTAIFAVSA